MVFAAGKPCLPLQFVSLRSFRCLPSMHVRCGASLRGLHVPSGNQFYAASADAHRRHTPALATAADRAGSLFKDGPALLLERSVGERIAADTDLWQTGCFQAEVYPDLPIAATWRDLVQRTFNQKGGPQPAPPPPPVPACGGQPDAPRPWFVCTVAAQCRSREQLRGVMLSAAGVDADGNPKAVGPAADALLFVSGSHPARGLPAASRWLQTSFDMLQLASSMRQQGTLTPTTSLWAVENPLTSPVSRLHQKLDAGAEVVLTQPPLVWGRAERWLQEADGLGLSEHAKIVVGIPMVSSAGNLDFWLRLCQARELPEAQAVLESFPRQGDAGKEAFRQAVKRWNADLIHRVLGAPGVAGLHVMPLTQSARRLTTELLQEGVLPGRGCSAAA